MTIAITPMYAVKTEICKIIIAPDENSCYVASLSYYKRVRELITIGYDTA